MLSFMRLFVVLLTLPYLSLCQQQQSCNESEDQICTTTSTPIATPHRQLPDDFIDPCQDSQASCSQWANEGECLNNPNFMLAQCPRSCGTCVPLHDGEEEESENAVASSVCVDDEEKCSTWADMGECAINPLCKLCAIVLCSVYHISDIHHRLIFGHVFLFNELQN